MKLTLHTESLRCDASTRTVTGLALPYGEPGRTNLGTVTASKGSGIVLAEKITANWEHEGTKPVGRMVSSEDTDGGVVMAFHIANTTRGNDLLAEIDEGLRTGMSVEIDDPQIKNGELIGGTVTAVAFVTKPAFPSAQVTMAAADTEPTEDDEPEPVEADAETVEEDPESETSDEDTEETEETIVTTATASLAASAATGATSKAITTVQEFTQRLVAARNGGDRQMLAALSDIVSTGITGDISQAQFLGELWSGRAYQRSIVPLVQPGSLTSYEVTGWRWTTKPEVAEYDGDKGAVPSGTVGTEPATVGVERIAGAHDIDRKFQDFGDQAFLGSYLSAMTESYARLTDTICLNQLVLNATDVTAGTVPSGVSPAAAAIVDGALAVLDYGVPDFAIVSPDMWRSLLLTRADDTLQYLNLALGLEEGTMKSFRIVPRSDMNHGSALVGIKGALQFFELPGVPIRVDAINIANGGLDTGLFGYYAVLCHDANGLALVDTDGPFGS